MVRWGTVKKRDVIGTRVSCIKNICNLYKRNVAFNRLIFVLVALLAGISLYALLVLDSTSDMTISHNSVVEPYIERNVKINNAFLLLEQDLISVDDIMSSFDGETKVERISLVTNYCNSMKYYLDTLSTIDDVDLDDAAINRLKLSISNLSVICRDTLQASTEYNNVPYLLNYKDLSNLIDTEKKVALQKGVDAPTIPDKPDATDAPDEPDANTVSDAPDVKVKEGVKSDSSSSNIVGTKGTKLAK